MLLLDGCCLTIMNVFSPALHLDDGDADVDPEDVVHDEEPCHVWSFSCPVITSPEHVVGDEPGEDEEAEHVALLHAHQPKHDHEKYVCGQKILGQLQQESINR